MMGTDIASAATIEPAATHAVLIDVSTGTVLLNKNADEHMPTSSMSKTMTLYMVFGALKEGRIKLDDEFQISEKAWKMEGSRMFVKVGSKIKVEDLIRGVAIQSGNDATVALAEGLAGSEDALVESMNARARELGMNNSHFKNVSGWPDPDHYSSPRDLALLAQRMTKDFPEYYHYFGEKEFTYNKIRQPNRDPLLGRIQGADGIKTGHTEIAGYGLIGSVIRDGRRLVLVINGLKSEKDRGDEGARLLEWGFRNFENRTLFKKGDMVDNASLWLGEQSAVPLVADRDLTVVLPIDKRSELKMTVKYMEPLKAPIPKGKVVARLFVELPDQPSLEVDLLTGENVRKKGLFGRVTDRLHYLVNKS
jgi:D-alanyl-D-alanine carboxypeptidase (penicillin-binding protein 5/6)